jgi:hypothetical protein
MNHVYSHREPGKGPLSRDAALQSLSLQIVAHTRSEDRYSTECLPSQQEQNDALHDHEQTST